ncbi:Heme chaperone HemW [Sporomusa silvacetica DSM 10669]|uniref:Heme chaperone HemW n=1 Tax=Sporomusa silvacetica DSM 10669 TaxID=1123289 RepID=A0ABZ3ILZ4_9FIRM|nr:radical SAM family heme chaperone HemW [Sporomusa silvacetica]OZC23024.1 oxygen-independent coproporphyrinogen-III oxidase-like protein YqeR [Sporomusa silvacetica DSM 10669]
MSKLGLYVHIPFCRKKCLYCDFSSYALAEHLFDAYTTALCQQIADQGGMLCKPPVDTVYIGGGTPSVLPVPLLDKVLTSLTMNFTIQPGAEISMEANPGTVTKEQLIAIKAMGINRLSFGVQSFNDKLLACLGRIHRTPDSLAAIESAYNVGFTNISIDLMYGLPGQTSDGFAQELEQAVALNTSHISVYGLKLEAGTPLATAYDQGVLVLPDEIEEESMYDRMTDFLPNHGLMRYEISNFARPGSECRHNLKYWQYQPYLGLGCAAHSFLQGERTSQVTGIEDYIEAIATGSSSVAMKEQLTKNESMAEYIFLALRTVEGMGVAAFNQYFATDFFSQFGEVWNNLNRQGLVATDTKQIWLTERGMKFGNIVFRSFLPD